MGFHGVPALLDGKTSSAAQGVVINDDIDEPGWFCAAGRLPCRLPAYRPYRPTRGAWPRPASSRDRFGELSRADRLGGMQAILQTDMGERRVWICLPSE